MIAAAGEALRRAGVSAMQGRFTPSDNFRVLVLHDVPESTLLHFDRIARFVTQHRRPMTPRQLFRHYARQKAEPLCGPWILFTFDDGMLSSYRAAREVLDPLGIKAIFFVPTSVLELSDERAMKQFAWDRLRHRRADLNSLHADNYVTMEAHHLQELVCHGHLVLPHTHNHVWLSDITTYSLAEQELIRPRAILENLLHVEIDGFAFPGGSPRSVSSFAYEIIRSCYSICFTGLAGANSPATNPFFLHRDPICAGDSLRHVENVMSGVYDMWYKLQLRRLKRRAGDGDDGGRPDQ